MGAGTVPGIMNLMIEVLGSDSEQAERLCQMILQGRVSEEISLFILEADKQGLQ